MPVAPIKIQTPGFMQGFPIHVVVNWMEVQISKQCVGCVTVTTAVKQDDTYTQCEYANDFTGGEPVPQSPGDDKSYFTVAPGGTVVLLTGSRPCEPEDSDGDTGEEDTSGTGDGDTGGTGEGDPGSTGEGDTGGTGEGDSGGPGEGDTGGTDEGGSSGEGVTETPETGDGAAVP
ncbi:hypothetical protein GV791_23995 [Nocardia cyriacigeorgica]|uniref:Uncharacterized protein n=1 Tax=Nocardia cyriacigeorgica TaxID=135487 RepID=A0A6P1CW59_9NOCA|nr:hypothetical protein [Nocardia cyriacigeorgica]MBF6080235.1 hypothetical protein [Nocardia cyriacigeorgica]MBF6428614.1 hypothetical protein [Nocardia cyriacigeorgica]NEW35606.1 hypothetical protein [Nocardia cyriacigeorgica]BDT87495.1 hypothetical protein FMUAM8_32590 [Nocardia cyriacigeorgica]